jgi:hypothetical protein
MRLDAELLPGNHNVTLQTPFQVLIMSEESRLGREAIKTAYALQQLVEAGYRSSFIWRTANAHLIRRPIRSCCPSQPSDKLEREKSHQRTRDAMLRKAQAGHVTGGLVFGYENVDIPSPLLDAQGSARPWWSARSLRFVQGAGPGGSLYVRSLQSGGRRRFFYTCQRYQLRGRRACSNAMQIQWRP